MFTWLHLKILTVIVCCRTSTLGGHHTTLVFDGSLARMIDNEHLHTHTLPVQPETELLANRGEDINQVASLVELFLTEDDVGSKEIESKRKFAG